MADKAIMVDAETHAMWKERAAAEGVTLKSYVERSAEDLELMVRANDVNRQRIERPDGIMLMHSYASMPPRRNVSTRMLTIDPAKCTNRLRPGTYCRLCGTTHGKKSA